MRLLPDLLPGTFANDCKWLLRSVAFLRGAGPAAYAKTGMNEVESVIRHIRYRASGRMLWAVLCMNAGATPGSVEHG
jgi:hypothetical protein